MSKDDMPETLYVDDDYELTASSDPEDFALEGARVRVGVYKLTGYAIIEMESVTTVTPEAPKP